MCCSQVRELRQLRRATVASSEVFRRDQVLDRYKKHRKRKTFIYPRKYHMSMEM